MMFESQDDFQRISEDESDHDHLANKWENQRQRHKELDNHKPTWKKFN